MVTAGGSELRLSATVPRLSGLRNNVSLAAGRFSEPAALVSMLAVSAVAGIVAGEFTDVPLYATESLFVVSVAVVVGVISFVADGFSRLVTSGLAMAVSVSAVAGPTISWLVAGVVTDVSRFVVSFVAGRFSASDTLNPTTPVVSVASATESGVCTAVLAYGAVLSTGTASVEPAVSAGRVAGAVVEVSVVAAIDGLLLVSDRLSEPEVLCPTVVESGLVGAEISCFVATESGGMVLPEVTVSVSGVAVGLVVAGRAVGVVAEVSAAGGVAVMLSATVATGVEMLSGISVRRRYVACGRNIGASCYMTASLLSRPSHSGAR